MKVKNCCCWSYCLLIGLSVLLLVVRTTTSQSVNDNNNNNRLYLGNIHQKRAGKLLFPATASDNKDENADDNKEKRFRARRKTKENYSYDREQNKYTVKVNIAQHQHKLHQTVESNDSDETILGDFTAAKSLHYFKHELDESVFEWINPDHVQAGGQTCGYLYPPLSHATGNGEAYPTIKVKFCMRFADIQPAPKGNMILHCGGPGSLSSCGLTMALGADNLENYNTITLDQRGLGMSWPNFAHAECTYGTSTDRYGDTVLTGMNTDYIDATNDTMISEFLHQQKKRVAACWTCETCDFHLKATDGSDKTYHFLQHSGTRQVAEDMELFRKVIGSDKVSLFGVSYGTQIMATYATMFPQHVDKFVIDSNMPPQPDLEHLAKTIAENSHHRSSYLGYTCDIRNTTIAGSCDIDLNYCFQNVFNFYTEIFHSVGALDFDRIFFAEFTKQSTLGNFKDACDASSARDEVEFLNSLLKIEVEQIRDPQIQACLPGIYDKSVDLLDQVGTPSSFDADGSTRVGLAAYVLTFLADYETCQQFVRSSDRPEVQEKLVYNLWEEEYEPLYNYPSSSESKKTKKDNYHHQRTLQELTEKDCSGPTWVHELYPFLVVSCADGSITNAEPDMKPYAILMGEPSNIPQTMVFGQSMSGSTYDEQHVIQQVKEVYNKYGGSLYGEAAASNFIFWYTLGYYWPQAQPVPPAGDISITGIVSGQLYDYVTAYKFTQEMKKAFPSTTLITSQWTQHGFVSAQAKKHGSLIDDMGDESLQESCQPLINRYFELGYAHVADGHVCEARLPDTFTDF